MMIYVTLYDDICSDVVVPIRSHTVYGQHFLQLLVGHTIPYSKFWYLFRQYNYLLLFFSFTVVLCCQNILLKLLQVKTQLEYVIVNKNIIKYACTCLWVKYSRWSDIGLLLWRSVNGPQMLQFCLFSVLKRNIFHCILYYSRLLCLAYPLHIFYHYITAYTISIYTYICICTRLCTYIVTPYPRDHLQ